MPIGTVDSRYSVQYEGAAVSSQSCSEDPSDEGTLLVVDRI